MEERTGRGRQGVDGSIFVERGEVGSDIIYKKREVKGRGREAGNKGSHGFIRSRSLTVTLMETVTVTVAVMETVTVTVAVMETVTVTGTVTVMATATLLVLDVHHSFMTVYRLPTKYNLIHVIKRRTTKRQYRVASVAHTYDNIGQ